MSVFESENRSKEEKEERFGWVNEFSLPITLTKVVLPEYWRPTKVSSISSFQKRLLNQSRTRVRKENMMMIVRGIKRSEIV